MPVGSTTAPSRHQLGRVTAAASAVVAGTALLCAGHHVSGTELAVARRAYDLPSWSTPAWRAVMQCGTQGAIVVVAVALLVLRRVREALVTAASAGAAWGLGQLGKDLVGRGRPTAATLGRPIRDVVGSNGFPSTHTAVAAALATALIVALPLAWPWRLVLVALALGTAIARIHVTAHWPLDVVGGGALGVAVACAGGLVVRRGVAS